MALPSSIWRRDTRANQPAATAVAAGTIYYVTDESVTERSTGTAWEDVSDGSSGVADGATLSTGLTFPNTGLHILDTNASHDLIIAPGSNITADRTLTVNTGDDNTAITLPLYKVVGITIDGGGSAITTGTKGYIGYTPFAGTIVGAYLIADAAGAIVIDVWKANGAIPTNGDSITSATPPTLTNPSQYSADTTLTSWTTSVAIGDRWGFNVDSATTVTRVTLEIVIRLS